MAKSGPAPLNDTNKLLAALSYPIWIIALIMILTDASKNDKFVRYHGWQGLWIGHGPSKRMLGRLGDGEVGRERRHKAVV